MSTYDLFGEGLAGGGLQDTVTDILTVGAAVLSDPALPEVVGLATELMQFEQGPSGSSPGGTGIGLVNVVPFLRMYIFYREHPILSGLILMGVVAVPVLVGVSLGKKKCRRNASRPPSEALVPA